MDCILKRVRTINVGSSQDYCV